MPLPVPRAGTRLHFQGKLLRPAQYARDQSVRELEGYSAKVNIYDPWADRAEAKYEYAIDLLEEMPAPGSCDALVVAVAHDQFKTLGINGLRRLANGHAVIYDIKGLFPKTEVDGRL